MGEVVAVAEESSASTQQVAASAPRDERLDAADHVCRRRARRDGVTPGGAHRPLHARDGRRSGRGGGGRGLPRVRRAHLDANACTSIRPVLDRPVVLLVNPAAGGGRALKALPGVEAALRGAGVALRTERTRSLDHARELATGRRRRRRRRRHALGRRAHRLRCRRAARPRGRAARGASRAAGATTSCACSGLPRDPVEAATLLPRCEVRRLDVGDVDGATFIGDRVARVRQRREPHRQRRALRARSARLRLRRATRHWPATVPRRSRSPSTTVRSSRGAPSRSRLRTARPTAVACSSRPAPSWTTGCSTS